MNLPIGSALLCVLAVSAAGCGPSVSAPPPTAGPTAPPAPTPTIEVGFVVAVTPVATPPLKHQLAQPSSTPFAVPKSTYLQLIPASGPPANRTITVAGGHLPPTAQVQIVWAASKHGATVEATAHTDRKGKFRTAFAVPASPPGEYTITAQVHGLTRAKAHYRIFSAADIAATIESTRKGQRIVIVGSHFLPNLRLLLLAYPVLGGSKPIVLGTHATDVQGKLRVRKVLKQLSPGQYDLRAWSISQVSALMAEAFFQVDV